MAGTNATSDVLIIEDTLSMAIMYQQHLKKAGYSSEVCQSGTSALIELRKGHVTTVLLVLILSKRWMAPTTILPLSSSRQMAL